MIRTLFSVLLAIGSLASGKDIRVFIASADQGIDKVMIYAIDLNTAKLHPAGFVSLPAGAGPRHMKFGKDGKQAYVLNELDSSISIFDREAAGKLSFSGHKITVSKAMCIEFQQ